MGDAASTESRCPVLVDLACVLLVRALIHLPIIVDPSHAPGRRAVVLTMARAAIAAGAQGLIREVPPDPTRALCDGRHSMTLQQVECFSLLDGSWHLCLKSQERTFHDVR